MRIPAVAGTFYPSDPTVLRSQISQCFREGPGEPCGCSGRRAVSAVLSPHAGYLSVEALHNQKITSSQFVRFFLRGEMDKVPLVNGVKVCKKD